MTKHSFIMAYLLGLGLILILIPGCGRVAAVAADELLLTLEVGEKFEFTPNELNCRPGQTVRLRLTSKPMEGGSNLAHNVAVLEAGVDIDIFGQTAITARVEDGYIPQDFRDQLIAVSALAHLGETVEIVFVAPRTSGFYPIVCSFPGHCLLGMRAMLHVK